MNLPSISDIPSSLEHLRKDAAALGHEAADMAREKLMKPARRMARDSRGHIDDAVDYVHDAADRTGKILAKNCGSFAGWVKANPFAAVGIAVFAGFVLSSMTRRD